MQLACLVSAILSDLCPTYYIIQYQFEFQRSYTGYFKHGRHQTVPVIDEVKKKLVPSFLSAFLNMHVAALSCALVILADISTMLCLTE